jgi:predicted small secreted protein
MKKLHMLIAVLLICITLAGCGMMDGEMYSVTAHKLTDAEEEEPALAEEVANYSELYETVLEMVKGRNENGTFRFTADYDGDVERDVSELCMDIPNNTPLGAYAVYYMSSSVSKYVSYYEAKISITYKKSAVQISSIRDVDTMAVLDEQLQEIIENFGTYFAFETSNSRLNAEYIVNQAQKIFFENPDTVLAVPTVTVNAYPEEAVNRIVEVTISYPENTAVLRRLISDLQTQSAEIASWFTNQASDQAVLSICQYLAGHVELTSLYEGHWSAEDSAYGALVAGSANSEGYAMAVKVLCDALEIPCVVVNGRYDNETHYWNIVSIDGEHYHMDASKFTDNGGTAALFLSDTRISSSYWWDTEAYPACDGGLTYVDVLGAQQPTVQNNAGPPEDSGEESESEQPVEEDPSEEDVASGDTGES